jgi:Cu+-exporting ATPase
MMVIVPKGTDREAMAKHTKAIPIAPSQRLRANLSVDDRGEGFQLTSKGSMRVWDPVCGRLIDMTEVVAAEDNGGWTYFFCSLACHGRFKASPGRYALERRRG